MLRVRVGGVERSAAGRSAVARLLGHTLGLGIDLAPFYAIASADPDLGPLAEQFRGMKPPRFPSLFEALVNAMSCQQVSLQAGLSVLNRLASAYGQVSPGLSIDGCAFPRPKDLACVDVDSLRTLGFSRQKSRSIIELAGAFVDKRYDFEALARVDDDEACQKLEALRGVGRWTAEYVLLRGLGRLAVFPGDDVGARNNLQRWLGRQDKLGYSEVKQIVRRWHPYAGLVYLHLLLKGLVNSGAITQPTDCLDTAADTPGPS